MADEQNQGQQGQQGPVFSIEKIYLKDLSVENPGAPKSFLSAQQGPQIEVGLNTNAERIEDGYFDVTVTVSITAKIGETALFLVEAKQAGVFQIRNVPENELAPLMDVHCANILFPYARETVSESIVKMGFPPIYIAPVNFEAIYQQKLEAELARLEEISNAQAGSA